MNWCNALKVGWTSMFALASKCTRKSDRQALYEWAVIKFSPLTIEQIRMVRRIGNETLQDFIVKKIPV